MQNRFFILAVILLVIFIALVSLIRNRKTSVRPVSELGKYSGYDEKRFNGSQRISDYLSLSDGTRLAYDLILPTHNGKPATEPMPVLFKYTPYLRTFTIFDKDGKNIIADLFRLGWKEKAMLRVRYWLYGRGHLMDPLFRTKWLENMIHHGYAVIVVERPGTGASFGKVSACFEDAAREADEILYWIARQPWCDGNIGMFGDSWQAQVQLAVAATGNPYLKAIMPVSTSIDNYSSTVYPGGIFSRAFGEFFSWSTGFLDSAVITPVDNDPHGVLLAQARAERGSETVGNKSLEVMQSFPYRDAVTENGVRLWEADFALYPFVERINQAGVPVYLVNGWYDLFTRDMFQLYASLSVPRRLLVRPLDHSQIDTNQFDLDYHAEVKRWFDYWLKGIDNGIMDEAPIHYYIMNAESETAWRAAWVWPLPDTYSLPYSFDAGKSGSIISCNDGRLIQGVSQTVGADTCLVDYTTTSGDKTRWAAINWPHIYPDMTANDAKTFTYTSPILEKPLIVVGHPIVTIWLQTTAPDLDVFVYMEEVTPDGVSKYITEGALRATHRALGRAPYPSMGLPFHSFYQSEMLTIPLEEPFELIIDLLPSAYQFSADSRIRITIAFADEGNFDTPALYPVPKVTLFCDAAKPSAVILSVSD